MTSFTSGISIFFLKNIVTKAFGFISTIIVARYLGPDEFGVVSITFVLLAIIQTIADSGIPEYVLNHYFHASESERVKMVSTGQATQVGLTAGISLIFLIIVPFWAEYQNDPRIVHLAYFIVVTFFARQIQTIPSNCLLALKKYKVVVLLSLISGILIPIGRIVAATTGFGVYSLVLPSAIIASLQTLVTFWLSPAKWKFSEFCSNQFKKILSYSKFLLGANILASLNDNAEKIATSHYFSLSSLGIFNLGHVISNVIPDAFEKATNNVLKATLPAIKSTQDKLAKYLKFVDYGCFFIFPLLGMVYVGIPDVIHRLYTEEWFEVIPVTQIILVGVMLRVFSGSQSSLINTLGVTKVTWKLNLWYSLFHVPLIIAFHYWGFLGLCWAVVVSKLLNSAFSFYYLTKYTELQLQPWLKVLVSNAIPTVIGVFVTTVLVGDINFHWLLNIMFKIGLFASLFLVVGLMVNGVNSLKDKLLFVKSTVMQYARR